MAKQRLLDRLVICKNTIIIKNTISIIIIILTDSKLYESNWNSHQIQLTYSCLRKEHHQPLRKEVFASYAILVRRFVSRYIKIGLVT